MIKLFISDFDGTLLDDMHMLSDETKQAIHDLRESGVSFMPASGRDYTAIQQIMQPIGVKVKCIALNGGEFFDNDGKVLISYKLPKEKTIQVHEIIDKYDVITDYYLENDRVTLVQDNVKATYLDYYMRSANKPMKDILHLFNELDFDNVVVSVKDINRVAEVGVVKIESQFANLDERKRCLEELKAIDGIAVTSSYGSNVEILSAQSTKGDMAESVCELYGYKKEEIVVIGDNYNDMSMITKFPNSYAMGNAVGEVKEAAKYQADTNRNHGVAKVMYEVIERNKKEKEQK